MSKVIHFELPADNIERAQKFYTEIFGWQFQKWDDSREKWDEKAARKRRGTRGQRRKV